MAEPTKHTDKEWVEHWRRLGPLLDAIRRQELRNFNYEENLPIIDALLQLGVDYGKPRNTSGLVELQRRLALLHYQRPDCGATIGRPREDLGP